MINARRGAASAVLLLFSAAFAAVAVGARAETRSTALPGTPQGWLERMSRALHSRSFEGTFVYLHSGQIETMRIVHEAQADGGERERVLALNG
ncbi:MAG TPA: hypothetical protein ENH08_02265, partial [Chromatiales bacterium]|nr:hypothetical protein [Chromatiales bacterium]